MNGACIWVRGRGGRADPLIRDQIWAFHLHIARTTPGYLCVSLAHIAHMCTHLHIYIYIYTRSELLTCPLHRCTAICARCHILYIARPTLSVLRCWHILHMTECTIVLCTICHFALCELQHFVPCVNFAQCAMHMRVHLQLGNHLTTTTRRPTAKWTITTNLVKCGAQPANKENMTSFLKRVCCKIFTAPSPTTIF